MARKSEVSNAVCTTILVVTMLRHAAHTHILIVTQVSPVSEPQVSPSNPKNMHLVAGCLQRRSVVTINPSHTYCEHTALMHQIGINTHDCDGFL